MEIFVQLQPIKPYMELKDKVITRPADQDSIMNQILKEFNQGLCIYPNEGFWQLRYNQKFVCGAPKAPFSIGDITLGETETIVQRGLIEFARRLFPYRKSLPDFIKLLNQFRIPEKDQQEILWQMTKGKYGNYLQKSKK